MYKASRLFTCLAALVFVACDIYGIEEAKPVYPASQRVPSDNADNTVPDAETSPDTGGDARPATPAPEPERVDNDRDSVSPPTDCDDNNWAVHPGATEICDGLDNDCDGVVDDAMNTVRWVDSDGDGYGDREKPSIGGCTHVAFLVDNDDDCDDLNRLTHPAANEICDGLDNDCDGAIDEGVADQRWCLDSDGDSFGDPERCIQSGCDSQSFLVDNDDDCNDASVESNPNADEICDGLDNDCDGEVDEGVMRTLYADNDGDGFGNLMFATPGCLEREGSVLDNRDCDDADADISPDADETCDGLDNNCNGLTDEDEPARNLCDDGDRFTTDLCAQAWRECHHEPLLVEFNCRLPIMMGDAEAILCGSAAFFATAAGAYGREIVQEPGGVLTLPASVVCAVLSQGGVLHVNTYAMDPADPFALWTGGEFTAVSVDGEDIHGSPGGVTLFSGVDSVYDLNDFEVCLNN